VTESQIRDDITVSLDVRTLHVLQKASTATYHFQKAAAAVVILLMRVEMRPKVVDTRCEDRNLDGSAPDVTVVELMLLDDFFSTDRHLFFASAGVCATREAFKKSVFPACIQQGRLHKGPHHLNG
jgi:hypothetical protein